MNFGDTAQIKGCTIKGRFLSSSAGNSSIDELLGGSMPNSCVIIVDEINSKVYAETLTKYFLSEGLYNDHDLLVIDPASRSNDFFTGLPSRIDSTTSTVQSSQEKEDMKIAWRYQSTPKVNSAIGSKNRYDLGKTLDDLAGFQSKREQYPKSGLPSYVDLLSYLRELLNSDVYSKRSTSTKKNLLRIVIRNLGSPLWEDPSNFSTFLAHLQYITKNSYCLLMATTSSTWLTTSQVEEAEVSCECFFRLVAMTDEEKKAFPSADKAHGYFQIIRLPRLTSIATHCPSAVDLVYELHRRSFDIKILHLPPLLTDPDPSTKIKTSCGNIDF